jgi:hypothetical protein
MATLQTRLSDLITVIGTDYKFLKGLVGDLSSLTTTAKGSVVLAINEINAKPSGTGGASIADGDTGTSTTTTYSASKIVALNAAQDSTIAGKAVINDTTASGTQVYSSNKVVALNSAQDSVIATKVDLSSAQTIAGVKTFSSAPVVPDGSFTTAKVSGLPATLAALPVINDTTPSGTALYSSSKVDAQIAALRSNLMGGTVAAAFDTFAELQALMQADDTESSGFATALANRVRTDTAAQGLTTLQQGYARTNINAMGAVEIGNPDTDLVALYTTAKA